MCHQCIDHTSTVVFSISCNQNNINVFVCVRKWLSFYDCISHTNSFHENMTLYILPCVGHCDVIFVFCICTHLAILTKAINMVFFWSNTILAFVMTSQNLSWDGKTYIKINVMYIISKKTFSLIFNFSFMVIFDKV